MFEPEGYLPLPTAVDRLVEARQTAGQKNDDGRNAVRAELRGKFYSDLISPLVVSRSGKPYKIRPYHWGNDELATTWFEQGECLLTDGLVDPPLGMLHGEERGYIFVPEHALQRLMAKQEVKQEAAPSPAATSGRGKQTAAVRAAFKTLFPSGSIPVGMSSQTRNDKIREELTNIGVKPLPDTRTIERALKGDG